MWLRKQVPQIKVLRFGHVVIREGIRMESRSLLLTPKQMCCPGELLTAQDCMKPHPQ